METEINLHTLTADQIDKILEGIDVVDTGPGDDVYDFINTVALFRANKQLAKEGVRNAQQRLAVEEDWIITVPELINIPVLQ